MTLATPFRRGKEWEKRIARFLPGAKLYGRGVSTPDFSWTPEQTGCELQFEIKSTSSSDLISEVATLRNAISYASIIAGYNGALEIYEGLEFIPVEGKSDLPYTIKYEAAYSVVTLEYLSFWLNNHYWFRHRDHQKKWQVRPPFKYYPPMSKKLKGLFHKGLKQLEKYLTANKARGGGVIIAAAGRRTRDQLCIIPNIFLGQRQQEGKDDEGEVQAELNYPRILTQTV